MADGALGSPERPAYLDPFTEIVGWSSGRRYVAVRLQVYAIKTLNQPDPVSCGPNPPGAGDSGFDWDVFWLNEAAFSFWRNRLDWKRQIIDALYRWKDDEWHELTSADSEYRFAKYDLEDMLPGKQSFGRHEYSYTSIANFIFEGHDPSLTEADSRKLSAEKLQKKPPAPEDDDPDKKPPKKTARDAREDKFKTPTDDTPFDREPKVKVEYRLYGKTEVECHAFLDRVQKFQAAQWSDTRTAVTPAPDDDESGSTDDDDEDDDEHQPGVVDFGDFRITIKDQRFKGVRTSIPEKKDGAEEIGKYIWVLCREMTKAEKDKDDADDEDDDDDHDETA